MNDTKGGTAMFNLEPVYVFSEKFLPWALPFHTTGGDGYKLKVII